MISAIFCPFAIITTTTITILPVYITTTFPFLFAKKKHYSHIIIKKQFKKKLTKKRTVDSLYKNLLYCAHLHNTKTHTNLKPVFSYSYATFVKNRKVKKKTIKNELKRMHCTEFHIAT